MKLTYKETAKKSAKQQPDNEGETPMSRTASRVSLTLSTSTASLSSLTLENEYTRSTSIDPVSTPHQVFEKVDWLIENA